LASGKEKEKQLYSLAETQAGLFTAKQAQDLGYHRSVLGYHVKNGDWVRIWRGIYRLTTYPASTNNNFSTWYLWSMDRTGKPKGVYAYDTALELHGLTACTSNKLHMIVPKYFQRLAAPPKMLKLHKRFLKASDCTMINGVAVTKPMRTLLDLCESDYLHRHQLREVFNQAQNQGLIDLADLDESRLTTAERHFLKELTRDSQFSTVNYQKSQTLKECPESGLYL